MATAVIREDSALALTHIRNLLGHASKRQTAIARTMVTDYDRPVLKFGWGIVYAYVEVRGGHGDLHSLFEEARGRDGCK